MISKVTNDLAAADFQIGEVLLIDKDSGISSFGIVRKLRKILGVKKIGHAGTLDPRATGLMILCTGKKTKEISNYQDQFKVYSGAITLGKRTPSMDAETEFTEEKDFSYITDADIEKVRKTFLGKIKQLPPMYSALKHKGKALYKYARKGQDVKRELREVEIYDFKINKIELPDVSFELKCSKGTYIRVIADDFGQKLGCGAYLKKLRREAIGQYNVKDAFTLTEFENAINSTPVEKE